MSMTGNHYARGEGMKSPAWIGIDPGKKGAVAVIDADGMARAYDWQDERAMLERLTDIDALYAVRLCVLEKVGAMPGQGVTSMFSFGQNYGWWLGAVSVLGWPMLTIRPQEWMKGIVGKEGSMPVAARLFPGVSLHGPKGGARDGRADALLLAHRARREVA